MKIIKVSEHNEGPVPWRERLPVSSKWYHDKTCLRLTSSDLVYHDPINRTLYNEKTFQWRNKLTRENICKQTALIISTIHMFHFISLFIPSIVGDLSRPSFIIAHLRQIFDFISLMWMVHTRTLFGAEVWCHNNIRPIKRFFTIQNSGNTVPNLNFS